MSSSTPVAPASNNEEATVTETVTPKAKFEFKAAVKFQRYELVGRSPAFAGTDNRPPSASNGQHARVRKLVIDTLTEQGIEITSKNIVKLTGAKTLKSLREIAEFQPDSNLESIREFGKNFSGDPWAQGRYLAGIIVSWIVLEGKNLTRADVEVKAPKKAPKADKPVETPKDEAPATVEGPVTESGEAPKVAEPVTA